MKKGFLLCLLCALQQVSAATWLTDTSTAYHQARNENKTILFNFTGSDWCGWCMRLQSEVFSKAEFEKFAKDNLVLVEIDFPRRKNQTAAVKRANESLASGYNVRGYPTIILADGQGKVVGRTGYQPGGAKMYVKELERILGKRVRVPFTETAAASPSQATNVVAKAQSAEPTPMFSGAPILPPRNYTGLQLKGISGSKNRRLAIINNETLGTGDAITMKLASGSVKIRCEEIKERAVVLKMLDTDQKLELTLGDPVPTTPAMIPVLK